MWVPPYSYYGKFLIALDWCMSEAYPRNQAWLTVIGKWMVIKVQAFNLDKLCGIESNHLSRMVCLVLISLYYSKWSWTYRFSERIMPWVHYVPVSTQGEGIYTKLNQRSRWRWTLQTFTILWLSFMMILPINRAIMTIWPRRLRMQEKSGVKHFGERRIRPRTCSGTYHLTVYRDLADR